jgi:hypothetical protein
VTAAQLLLLVLLLLLPWLLLKPRLLLFWLLLLLLLLHPLWHPESPGNIKNQNSSSGGATHRRAVSTSHFH